MQSTYDKGCDELIDESGAIDICAHCAAEGKLQPGLYFCCQCGPFGRYICGDCNKQHKKFLNGHKIRDVSTAAKQPGGSFNMQVDEITQAKQQLESLVKEIETRREVIDKVIPDGELARNIYEVRKKLSKDNSNDNELKSLAKKLSVKITKIWTQSGNGNDKKEKEPEPLKMLDEIEKCIKDNKATIDKQTQETASLEVELEKLEKEMEELLKRTMKQKNKTDNPSQRVKVISQTLSTWRNDDKSDNELKSLAKKLSVKITKIWTQSGNGNDKKEKEPEPLKMLDEIEKCIKDNKATIDKRLPKPICQFSKRLVDVPLHVAFNK